MTVAIRTMALGAIMLWMLAVTGDGAASGEDCAAAGEAHVMNRLESTIAWAVTEESDLCEGVEAVSVAAAAALDFFDACDSPEGEGSQRRYAHLTWYWAEQVKRESCTE